MSSGRQQQCVPWRISTLGETARRCGPNRSPALEVIARTKWWSETLIFFVFFAFDVGYKPLHPNLGIIDAQEIKAPHMVNSRRSYTEVRSQKQDACGKHCPNVETNRGGYSSKGFQSWSVAGFTRLIQSDQFTNGKPRTLRAFVLVARPWPVGCE
jgi:hypothetical protein